MPDEPRRTRPVPRDRLPTRQQREEARQQAQDYRAYAEVWYRALRGWDVRQHTVPVPRMSYAFARGFEPISTMGEGGPDLPTALLTPIGELRETEVARAISSMVASPVPDRHAAGGLLERVRGSLTAPVSLLREGGGWSYPAARTAGYAVAVLTLAVTLGDAEAEGPLRYAQAVLRRQEAQSSCVES
ncbi:hypothetical protein DEIPH_ctg052orf0030 [Deinococcus phoenicis]|uniref:Uncharacterized protein n=1 Tax=Deinococcus phoenicis TaxID=1476583 RepID=A0A016QMT2_9DEIO|nr:hypothetical protein [Deinococcus phoenicis]EYB67034.1 hypothetical protein DEIPH_ctg052orf0030 [Deinococcus phoenicis]